MAKSLVLIFALALCLTACKDGGEGSSAGGSSVPAVTDSAGSESNTWSKENTVPQPDDSDGAMNWYDSSDAGSKPDQTSPPAESKPEDSSPDTSSDTSPDSGTVTTKTTEKPADKPSSGSDSSGQGGQTVTQKPLDSSAPDETSHGSSSEPSSSGESSSSSASSQQDSSSVLGDGGVHWI